MSFKDFSAQLFFASLLILCVLTIRAAAQTSYQSPQRLKLQKEWEVTLPGDPFGFRMASCGDGAVYAMNEGHFQMIGADGRIAEDDPNFMSGGSTARIACGSDGRLFAADNRISVFERAMHGKFSLISSAPLAIPVVRLLAGVNGSIYGITAEAEPSLVAISESGEEIVLRKASDAPVTFSLTNASPLSIDRGCGLTWDETGKRLAYILPDKPSAEFWEPRGNVLSGKSLRRPKKLAPNRCLLLEMVNLVSLPGGQFARTRIERSELADVYDQRYVEILDRFLKPVARPIAVDALLFGASEDGSLYFVSFRPDQVVVTRQTLVPEDQ
jgi:hypothetical protein